MSPDDRCTTCRQTRAWHELHPETVHPFTDGASQLGATRERTDSRASSEPAVLRWPFDPVLRQALIDKGVLTVEDLGVAEEKIKTASMIMGGL